MTIAAGNKLGPYEILSPIGSGGMGEVYRAHDPRVGRDVAIKVSSEQFSDRFDREIRAVASLNHSNICTLYDVGPDYLVMELVEGPTLAERIKQGAIPLEESLEIARQIADALEAAHEKGIVHRDLKPANLKIKSDGTVKVLDFGLAKVGGIPVVSSDNSPTLSVAQTAAGVILGTAAYMSPEQAKGKIVDKRADIWAFGVVLYEMLTGVQLFQGEDLAETLAAVVKGEPDLSKAPAQVRQLLGSCLEKDPKKRLRDIGDIWRIIETFPSQRPAANRPSMWWWVTATALAVVGFGILLWWPWRAAKAPERPLARFDVHLGPDVLLGSGHGPDIIISPDGRRLVFVSNSRLFIRSLDQPKSVELSGTEGATDPFFSPDSKWIAFFADSKLKQISVEGGVTTIWCNAGAPRGGSWGEDGSIIAALVPSPGALSRISFPGAEPTPVTELTEGEVTHRWPQILPGGRTVLFTAHTAPYGFDNANIVVMSLKDRRRKVLHRGGTFGRYLPSGHVVYVYKGALFAIPFDPDKLDTYGPAAPVIQDVATSQHGGAQLDFSESGMFFYRGGAFAGGLVRLQWLDGSGAVRPLAAEPGMYSRPRISPDGRILSLMIGSGGRSDIWTYDWQRDTRTRLTSGEGNFNFNLWSPNGHFVLFCENLGGIFWTKADGSTKPLPLMQSKESQYPWSFSPDGKRLAFAQCDPQKLCDLWTVPVEEKGGQLQAGKPQVFLQTPAFEVFPAFSPDGRWIAYRSNESGRNEIYVRAFPDRGRRWQVSNNGGVMAIWSENRRELFYETDDRRVVVVAYAVNGDSFVPDKPRLWSEKRLADLGGEQNLDITPDGKRFVALMPAEEATEQPEQNRVTVLLNFFDELRRRVPTGAE